jgi:hypothetical protein
LHFSGRLFLGESLHRARVAGLVLGVIGAAFAIGVGPDALAGGAALRGEVIGVLSAPYWAAATIINNRANLPGRRSRALSFWQMLIGAVAVLGITYGARESWPIVTTSTQWAWFLGSRFPLQRGLSAFGLSRLPRKVRREPAAIYSSPPLFTVIISFFLLGTTLSWLQAADGLLIGIALWLVNREILARTPTERLNEALARDGRDCCGVRSQPDYAAGAARPPGDLILRIAQVQGHRELRLEQVLLVCGDPQIWHVGRVSHVSIQEDGKAPVSTTTKAAAGAMGYGYRPDGTPGFVEASPPRALETDEIAVCWVITRKPQPMPSRPASTASRSTAQTAIWSNSF